MIKCKSCKRITLQKESTGTFTTYRKLEKGKEIVNEIMICVNCSGECLLK